MADRLLRSFGLVRAEDVDAEGRRVTAIISTEELARDGAIIHQDGWDFQHFDKNPVVLFSHDDGSPPIARVVSHEVQEKKLRAVAEFDAEDEGAMRIFSKIRRGFINATSVRWKPLTWEMRPAEKGDDRHETEPQVLHFLTQELLEFSFVSIPADPYALIVRADGAALDVAEFDTDRAAIPSHDTAVTDTAWDGPAAVAAAGNDAAVLRYMHAWVDSDGDPDAKQSYKFPHHRGRGPANLPGVRNALARLPNANIPAGDRAGVERHLRRHLEAQESAAGDTPTREQLLDEMDYLRSLIAEYGTDDLARRLDDQDRGIVLALYEQLGGIATVQEGPQRGANTATDDVVREMREFLAELRDAPSGEEILVAALAKKTGRSPDAIREELRAST